MYHYNDKLDFPHRKSPRIKDYDYTTPGYYFVTICTHEKKCIFGKAGQLNRYGRIAQEGLNDIPVHVPSIRIDKCVVMPNHVHAIVIVTGGNISLPDVMGRYKAFVSRQIHKTDARLRVWQESFHDHIIRNQKQYEKIWTYIENNPLKWELDCFHLNEKEI